MRNIQSQQARAGDQDLRRRRTEVVCTSERNHTEALLLTGSGLGDLVVWPDKVARGVKVALVQTLTRRETIRTSTKDGVGQVCTGVDPTLRRSSSGCCVRLKATSTVISDALSFKHNPSSTKVKTKRASPSAFRSWSTHAPSFCSDPASKVVSLNAVSHSKCART